MRRVGVVTVARSDYGIYLPVLRSIDADPALHLHLVVAGAHLSQEFGMTVNQIIADGFAVGDRVEMLRTDESPEGIADSIARGVSGFARSFAESRPDILVVLGDRFEMFAAVVAALPFAIPVAHIHGGEVTAGAIDEALRHSMTKFSHLHFVATADYGRRVAQLGEEPWRIVVSGAPALDHLRSVRLLTAAELEAICGLPMSPAPLVVTFHPATLDAEAPAAQARELLAALDEAGLPVVFTQPNADPGARPISALIDEFVASHATARRVDNLGTVAYFSLMAQAAAMVGNSSSGLIEAASFRLPVVNVGVRQAGRTRAANVIDVETRREAIRDGIRRAVSPAFRAGLATLVNPFGDGHAAERIVERLTSVSLNQALTMKMFHDLAVTA